jgi:hypothetical protein
VRCGTDSKAMTLTSPPGPPTPGLARLRERHFAGGVQEKKENYSPHLNTNETKAMDCRQEGVIAPSKFASPRFRAAPKTSLPCGSLWRGVGCSSPPPLVEAGNLQRKLALGSTARSTGSTHGIPDAQPSVGDPLFCGVSLWRVRHLSKRVVSPHERRERHRPLLHSLWITCDLRHSS